MSDLSLLFTSELGSMSNVCLTGREVDSDGFSLPDGTDSAWNGSRGAANDYLLPSGIASLEHWLDLNA
jgi:hypothetical protein